MPKLIICRGLPASGKTTWAKAVVEDNLDCLIHSDSCRDNHTRPTHKILRVNRDDLRAMLHSGTFVKGVTEDVVIAVRDAIIRTALRRGWDVISDDTNLRSRNVRDLLKVARSVGAEVKFEDFTDVPWAECVARDRQRDRDGGHSVGHDIIFDQYNRFIKGRKLPLPIPDLDTAPTFESVPHGSIPTVVADMDGTMAINGGHRGFYEYSKVGDDTPNSDVIAAVRGMYFLWGSCFVVSGRSDECYDITKKWIEEHVFADSFSVEDGRVAKDRVVPQGVFLLMREAGDFRDDSIVKYELYRDYIAPKFDVKMVFDDRDRVVRMWRQVGLTCAQVAYGDF